MTNIPLHSRAWIINKVIQWQFLCWCECCFILQKWWKNCCVCWRILLNIQCMQGLCSFMKDFPTTSVILERFSKQFFPYFILFWAKQSGKYLMMKKIKENRVLMPLFIFSIWWFDVRELFRKTNDIPLGTECLKSKLSGIFFFDNVNMILSKAFHWKTSWKKMISISNESIKWNENMKYNKVISHIIQGKSKNHINFNIESWWKKSDS